MSDKKEFKGFSRDILNECFYELSKEIKKEFGRNAKVELIVVGGAAILLNHDFREATVDVDAIISSQTSIKDAVNRVGDKYGLPNGWINSDFKKTNSYSPKLVQVSKYYKTFNQSLTIRTIDSEYLIAMKLASLRKYKYDKSDIIGIIQSNKNNVPMSFERIDKAVRELYGTWDKLPSEAKDIVNKALNQADDKDLYSVTLKEEALNKKLLTRFEQDYDNVLKEDNIDFILNSLQQKEGNKAVSYSLKDKIAQNKEIISQKENSKLISHSKKKSNEIEL